VSGKPSDANRRTSERIQTHHHVVFSDYRALGPLRTGTAVDRSSGGLRIITPHPEPLGTTLQIELRASPDSGAVLLLEGRVVHITPVDKGQHAMGIRLIHPTLRTQTPLPTRERRVLVATVAASTAASQMKSPTTVVAAIGMPPDMDMSEAVTFRRVEDGGRPGSWLALIAILALVVILILLVVEALRREQRISALEWFRDLNVSGMFAQERTNTTPEDAATAIDNEIALSADSLDVGLLASLTRGGEPAPVSLASVAPAVGVPAMLESPADAAIQPGIPETLRGASPLSLEQFSAMLDYADRAAARGEAGLARAVVRRAMNRAGALPAAWRDLGAEYQARLGAAGDNGAPHPLSTEIELDTPGTAKGAPNSLRLDVDTGDHMLRVWRGDQMLAEFPVGLGRDGATPHGDFRIGAKARNPDWYHEGRIVPAGDPGNPIGDQWLALQQNGARTGIGIHPTAQPESIGANHSLGCVRMRPEDAEALYRLAPVGTTVSIHP